MSELIQLKIFVNKRLAAAAEEIFGAVERIILELQSKSVFIEDVKPNQRLLLAECERAEEEAAVSLDVNVSETVVSTQTTTEDRKSGSLDTQGPELLEDEVQELQRDRVILQDLLHGEACVKTEQSTETFSCGQSQTQALLLVPHVSVECEEEATGCGESDYYQPLTSESENRQSDISQVFKSTEVMQGPIERNTNAFCCKLCGETFCSWGSFLTHIELHTASRQGALQPSGTNTENNQCHICSKTFKTKEHLKRHMLTHTGERKYCCMECGRRFARGECLRIHMRIHSMEKPYTCEVCKKMFRQKIHLVTHMRIHTGEKPYHCNICSAKFAYKVDLIKHAKTHKKT